MRILEYLPNVLSKFEPKGKYRIYSSNIAGTIKYIRPINCDLFIFDSKLFEKKFAIFINSIEKLKLQNFNIHNDEVEAIDKVSYTLVQSDGLPLEK